MSMNIRIENGGLFIGLSGMPDTKGEIFARRFSTVDEAIDLLKDNRAVTQADRGGAITVWIDDAGTLRAEYHFNRIRASKFEGTTEELREWLTQHLPLVYATTSEAQA